MRAPNGRTFPLLLDKESSLLIACDLFRRCDEQFSIAAEGKLLQFDISPMDSYVLGTYDKGIDTISGQLYVFLNDVMERLQMPFGIRTVMASTGSLRFFCRVERTTTIQQKKHGEAS